LACEFEDFLVGDSADFLFCSLGRVGACPLSFLIFFSSSFLVLVGLVAAGNLAISFLRRTSLEDTFFTTAFEFWYEYEGD